MAEHHNSPTVGVYLAVFATLMVLTGVTIWVAFLDLEPFNNLVAIGIACFKALIVILYFMHVRYSSRLIWLFVGSGFVFLLIFFAFIMADYFSRGWDAMPGSMYLQ